MALRSQHGRNRERVTGKRSRITVCWAHCGGGWGVVTVPKI